MRQRVCHCHRPDCHDPCWMSWVTVCLVCLGFLLLGSIGCQNTHSTHSTTRRSAGPDDWLAWQEKRWESLAGTNGWTTLVARHWLPEGLTFAGTSSTNHLILPAGRAPAAAGSFLRQGRNVRFEAAPGVPASIDGRPVRRADLSSDVSNAPTRLILGPLSFVVIERGERLGVRVRDSEAPARRQFKRPECFPYDPAWRLAGQFEPFATPRTLRVQDMLGGTQDLVSPGAIVFHHDGQPRRLDVVEEPGEDDLFVLFRDRTTGTSTYPSGRFLYVARPARPEAGGRVTIDFNRAYTPPCGFTPFAVCPLPPPQNWLPFAIPAGEKKPQK